ncbi:MAG: hypothetical protein GSR81_05150 [Desulfurococcales archaeon]|nr:hypothetical protein [Desulfurococcales archaeon]
MKKLAFRHIGIVLVLLLVVAQLGGLALHAYAEEQSIIWRYAARGKIISLQVSYDAKHIFVLDDSGYVYFLDKDGNEITIKRFTDIAFDDLFNPVFKLADKKVILLVAETVEDGQVYYAYSGDGKRLWSVLIPGYTLSYDISHGGSYVAIAYRPLEVDSANPYFVLELYSNGEKTASLNLQLSSIIYFTGIRVAVTDNGIVAVFRPDIRKVELYDSSGTLIKSYAVDGEGSLAMLSIDDEGTRLGYCLVSGLQCTLTEITIADGGSWSARFKISSIPVIAYSADLSLIALKNDDINVTFVDTVEKTSRTEIVRDASYIAVDYEGDNIVVSGDKTIYIFRKGLDEAYETTIYGTITSLAISGDGRLILAGDDWGRVYAIMNPAEEKTSQIVSIIVGGIVIVLGTMAIVIVMRKKEKPEPEEEEEIYPA